GTVLGYAAFFFSSRRRHTRAKRDWSSDVCSSDLSASPEGATVTVAPSGDADPYAGLALPHYQSGQAQDVPDAEFEVLLGHAVPQDRKSVVEGKGGAPGRCGSLAGKTATRDAERRG